MSTASRTVKAKQPETALVSGGNILSMLAAMGPFRARGEQMLGTCGIADVQPAEWYSLIGYVHALRLIEHTIGRNTLYRVGQEIPKHINLPPGLDSFEAVIGSFGPAFELNHRGAGAGDITYRITGPSSGVIVAGTPYPCDFDRGVIQGFFNTLLNRRCVIEHDPLAPRCKQRGGGSCTHVVRAI